MTSTQPEETKDTAYEEKAKAHQESASTIIFPNLTDKRNARLGDLDSRALESTRELLSMFYGLLFAYDEGLAKDDRVLAAAVWRNLFHACKAKATQWAERSRLRTEELAGTAGRRRLPKLARPARGAPRPNFKFFCF